MKNFGTLVIAFIIAIFLTVIVNDKSGSSSVNLNVPIVTSNLPEDKIVILSSKSQVQVTIKGPSYLLSDVIAKKGVNLDIKFPNNITTTYTAKIKPSDFKFPAGVDVLSIEPSEVTFSVDNVISKRLPVVVPRIGTIDEMYKLLEFKVEPEFINVKGSEIELKGIKRIQTEPVDLRNITEDSIVETNIRAIGQFTTAEEKTVKVKISVRALKANKEFKGVSIDIRNQIAKPYEVDFKTVDLLLSGAKKDIDNLTIDKIKPYVTIKEDTLVQRKAQVFVELPVGIELLSVNPKNIFLKERQVIKSLHN